MFFIEKCLSSKWIYVYVLAVNYINTNPLHYRINYAENC